MDALSIRKLFDPSGSGTGKIHLRLLLPSDFGLLYSVAADPEIWQQHPDRTRYTKEGFEKFFRNALADDCCPLLVIHPKSGEVMGSSRYYRYDEAESTVFIGFTFLARKFWGGIWNSRLKLAMLELAFRHCQRVFFEAAANNVRSVTALQKLGAEKVPHPDPEKVQFQISLENWPEIREKLIR